MGVKRIATYGVSLIAAVALIGSTAYAQTSDISNGFKISPVIAEFTIEPGQKVSTSIEATNPSNGTVTADVVVNDFVPSQDESGKPSIIVEEGKAAPGNSFKSLVGDLGEVTLGPNETKKIPYDIVVPENAAPGGYYGAVRLEAKPGTEGRVNLSASVGTLHLITVPGDFTESMRLVELSAAKDESTGRFFFGKVEKMQIVTRLENNGNIHLKPYGRIVITDSKGKEVESYEFNDTNEGGNVLPKSTRKFVDNLTYNDFSGKYTITANLGYGSGGNLITAKNTFWVIPLWMLISAAALLVALIIGGILIYRKISSSRKHKVKPRR